ncbi:microtubule binding protein [Anopheles darlingi]|uniref:Microtubule binding protein n=1 Tax=Anopheles darlingi TaxID=43151 RepID=W5J7P7_ANODA|nr:centrosome-associated zinc finger protein CP190 [Anopheles darlingi]XP_049548465.1 centrosome-associated zinc finger protein CP190 [Anopheles darlingi]ETN60482.1 microtubule binding protein [Anopheles darlingi]
MNNMTRYSEAKSVKVDNWGVFFLQKLQNFFNKTDHCDLTLQFNDNSQLKVHRLVLSACTDYFNHLESVCEMYDDVLIMPMDLQADVIVPIVNFMYTGTLEFQYTMYERLLKTATDMNMTVLLKLLEAHRQTSRISKQPVLLNKQAPRVGVPVARAANTYHATVPRPANTVVARAITAAKPRLPIMRQQISPGSVKGTPESSSLAAKYGHAKESKSGPSRFDDTDLSEGFEGSFDAISYESKPLLTADQVKKEEEPSPFEKLRKGYTNTNVAKRASGGSITSPPAKKPNLEEVKEFTEAARLRSQLNTDDDDSPDYVDDDTHFNDDDDEDYQPPASVKSAIAKAQTNKQIVVKQETKSPNALGSGSMKQITVKDESGNVDHAKIISEVLKKYPHLVKQNKNIKLKIMQKMPSGSSQAAGGVQAGSSKVEIRTATPLKQDISMVRKATASIRSGEQQQKTAGTTSSTAVAGGSGHGNSSSKNTTATATATKPNPPKTIDAKTMHALIAKGAENMTGPWLCLRCGINGRPISIPSYKAFRNHLIVKHKERIDSRICEHCGWRAETRNPHLVYHWLVEHGIKSPVKFPACTECDHVAMNNELLKQHMEQTHQQERQHCIYCNKVFEKEQDLYCHMKEQHRERARSDGVLDFSEDEDEFQEQRDESPPVHRPSEGKIKILSNITLPPTKPSALPFVIGTAQSQRVSQSGGKASSEAEALSNVASGIATSLRLVGDTGVVIDDPNYQNEFIEAELASVHGENATTISAENSGVITKLLSEDGTELQLTPSQREDIISQLQINSANVVMMNEVKFVDGSTLQINDGVQIVNSGDTDGTAAGGNQNIMLVYSDSATEERKENSNDDVAPSEDDENSQNSAALSEKASSSTDKPADTVAPEEEESQESRKTDATDGKEAGEEDDTVEDVDMLPSDASFETNEPVKPTTKAGTRDDKKAEKHKQHKEDVEEDRQRSDKLKLISELEGDWSEDTEEHSTTTVSTTPATKADTKQTASEDSTENRSNKKAASIVEKKSVTAKVPVVGAASAKKPSNPEKDKKKEDKPNVTNTTKKTVASEGPAEKEIDKLLDEWNNEPSKQDDSDTEAELAEKTPKADGLVKIEKEEQQDGKQKENDDTETMETDEVIDAPASKSSDAEMISKTSSSTNETDDATKAKKTETSSKVASAKKVENLKVAADDEDEDQDEDDKEKASKSKDVSSLLGEWDEDDEL